MKPIERTIASTIIFSKDGKILMGKKDPNMSGSFSEYWHIPGGGIEDGETLEQALVREVMEEAGLDISNEKLKPLDFNESVLFEKNGVLYKMHLNRFEIRLDQLAEDIILKPTSELVILQWLTPKEISQIEQIPGGKDFFEKMGYLK